MTSTGAFLWRALLSSPAPPAKKPWYSCTRASPLDTSGQADFPLLSAHNLMPWVVKTVLIRKIIKCVLSYKLTAFSAYSSISEKQLVNRNCLQYIVLYKTKNLLFEN